MTARRCIFCDVELTGENRAKEHVVPQWLLEHLEIGEEELFQGVALSENSEVMNHRTIATRSMVEGRVCEPCYGGWMCGLENEAKSLLIALLDGTRTVHALTNAERSTVSTWATKTAYVLSYPTPLNDPINPAHLRHLRDHRTVPVGTGVFAQQHKPTGKFSYLQKNTWPHFSEARPGEESARVTSDAGYKIALQFAVLMLLVTYWPPDRSTYALVSGVHVPLWPMENFYLCYYGGGEVPTPYDSRSLLERFNSSLAICHRI